MTKKPMLMTIPRRRLLARAALLAALPLSPALLTGCDPTVAIQAALQKDKPKNKGPDEVSSAPVEGAFGARPVIIYSNADEEAQLAMRQALDASEYRGRYRLLSFGTSELGGKVLNEGVNIEADLITLSAHYLPTIEAKHPGIFKPLELEQAGFKPLLPTAPYAAPMIGICGAILVNERVLEEENLPKPKAIRDLASPQYRGLLAVPDLEGSSSAWLMTLALTAAYGEEEGVRLARAIEKNAEPHLEMSGSGPLKKLRAGEAGVGFGLRHQAKADHRRGLPIDAVDPEEGVYALVESAALIDKPDANPDAAGVLRVLSEKARPLIIKDYPVALYEGEKLADGEKMPSLKAYPEPLTTELLSKHLKLVKAD